MRVVKTYTLSPEAGGETLSINGVRSFTSKTYAIVAAGHWVRERADARLEALAKEHKVPGSTRADATATIERTAVVGGVAFDVITKITWFADGDHVLGVFGTKDRYVLGITEFDALDP